jgi:hypothetical protein
MVSLAAAALGVLLAPAASADSHHAGLTRAPFTAAELAANWHPDRTMPSGGYGSVTFAHRRNVLEMNVDSTNASSSGVFYLTEGLQRALPDVTTVQADLFVDRHWLASEHSAGTQVRAGLWGVAYNSAGTGSTANITAYPIMEFTTVGDGGFVGWRSWDGVNGGWTNLPQVRFRAGHWNSVQINLNASTGMFDLYVNHRYATSSPATDGTPSGTTASLGAVILNQYNFDTGNATDNYSVHWSRLAYGTAARHDDEEFDD